MTRTVAGPGTPLTPDTIVDGKYRVVRPLGEGGMGQVFVAEHVFLKRLVALKVLHEGASAQQEMRLRFEQEARAASQIDHPSVVRVTDFGQAPEGWWYLVMELLDGTSLAARLAERGTLPTAEALAITQALLAGLEAAHALGILHRDLKPENVILVRAPEGGERPKIVDFGIAKLERGDETRLTAAGALVGTPLYMAPEQARGEPLDARADLHAVGVLLYEMLSGTTPYRGGSFMQILAALMEGRPRPLTEAAPTIAPIVAGLVMKAIAPAPGGRFASAAEMRAALARAAAEAATVDRWDASPDEAPQARAALPSMPARPDPAAAAWDPARPLEVATLGGTPVTAAPPGPDGARSTASTAGGGVAAAGPALGSDHPLKDLEAIPLDRPPPVAAPTSAGPPPARLLRGVVLLAVGAAVGLGLYVGRRAPTGPAIPALVHLRVVGLPPHGRVLVDGVPRPTEFDLPGARAPVRVSLEARGHATRLLLVVPDGDQTIDGTLERSR